MFVHTIYMTIDIYTYTHICTMYVYVCVCIVMYGCLPASFQPPSSILTASISFQPPSSPLPASLQPPLSLLPAYIINLFLMHRCIDHQFVLVHMCIDNQSCLIYIYVHSPFIFIHACTVFFLLLCLSRTHVGAHTKDVYPLCSALDMHIMPYDRLVFVELHIQT